MTGCIPAAEVALDPYVMLSTCAGRFELWFDVEKFPRQFVRRNVAHILGIPDLYNWRRYPFVEQMELTHQMLVEPFAIAARTAEPEVRWKLPDEIRCYDDPSLNPHITLFFERNIERLLFFAGCRGVSIAEEALDQLRRFHLEGRLSPLGQTRASAAAILPLYSHYDTCTSRAALDLLRALGKAPKDPPRLYGPDDDD